MAKRGEPTKRTFSKDLQGDEFTDLAEETKNGGFEGEATLTVTWPSSFSRLEGPLGIVVLHSVFEDEPAVVFFKTDHAALPMDCAGGAGRKKADACSHIKLERLAFLSFRRSHSEDVSDHPRKPDSDR